MKNLKSLSFVKRLMCKVFFIKIGCLGILEHIYTIIEKIEKLGNLRFQTPGGGLCLLRQVKNGLDSKLCNLILGIFWSEGTGPGT